MKKQYFSIPKECEFKITLTQDGESIFHMGYNESEERFYFDTYSTDADIYIKMKVKK